MNIKKTAIEGVNYLKELQSATSLKYKEKIYQMLRVLLLISRINGMSRGTERATGSLCKEEESDLATNTDAHKDSHYVHQKTIYSIYIFIRRTWW